MKIMTAMYTIRKGGAYDRFIMMLEAFLERNCEMHCLSFTPIPIIHSYFHNHVIHLPIKTRDGFITKLVVVFLFPIWSLWIAWSKKIDLIIAFGSLYAFLQGFSKWILKIPMVTFIRGNSYFGLRIQNSPQYFLHLNKIIEYLGFLFSDRIITNNSAAQNEILKRLGMKKKVEVQVLYNNIPPMNIRAQEDILKIRDRYGVPRGTKVLVTAGIINRGKNIETLINCLLKIAVRDICLLIVGDGSSEADFDYKDSLKQLVKKLGIDQQVIFTGWLEKEDLWGIYQASDLFVLTSLSEGMPNALLEALHCDLRCLGSDIPGVSDILHSEDLLFDPENGEAIANKIKRFLSDERYANHLLQLCRERKKIFVFDWKEKVFKAVIKEISSAAVN